MVDLVQWLTACLDEDERIARAAEGDPVFDGTGIVIERNRARGFPDRVAGLISPVATHIAVWDPARVLREIDAKRMIVAAHERRPMPKGDSADCAHCWGAVWPCPTLRLLASVYDDRPGFREEWSP